MLKNFSQKNLAKYNLSNCKQFKSETVNSFNDRLRKIVRIITQEQSSNIFKESLLKEFLERLESELRFYVKGLEKQ